VHRDPSGVDTWGAAARAVMLDRFSPSLVAAGYMALYDAALQRRA